MKLQAQRKSGRDFALTHREKLYLTVILAMLFLLSTTFIFLNLEEGRYPLLVLQNSQKSLLAEEGYHYTTGEKGSGYEVSFEGFLSEEGLVGYIEAYDIYIYQDNIGLYVRNEDTKEWVEASSQGLSHIECFLMGPADVLKHVLAKENKQNMLFKEEGHVIHIPYEEGENELAHALFPGIPSNAIKNFSVDIWLDTKDLLQKIELTMHLLLPDSTEETISRSITLDYAAEPDLAYPDI